MIPHMPDLSDPLHARADGGPAGEPKPPAVPHRIVIVGGVAGGMSCAARARRLDEHAEIILLERGDHVSVATCGLPYYLSGEIEDPAKLQVQTPRSLAASLDLDVRVRHEVIGLDPDRRTVTVRSEAGVGTLGYDALVLSPGALPARPPIPGLDSPRVRTLRTIADVEHLREDLERGARRAVVLGAGFIGLEVAEALREQGLAVAVVELTDHVLPALEPELASRVAREMRRIGIDVRAGVGAAAITHAADADTVTLSDGTSLQADIVVMSVGVRPDTGVFEAAGVACERGAIVVDAHGRTSVPGVWAVGDAVVSVDAVTGIRAPVPLAGPANRAGRQVADDILRPDTARPVPPTVGTAIVRMGSLTIAMTGSSHDRLVAQGIGHHTIHLHPNDHAGYFPGAHAVHLVVHFRTGDGLLLGAQAVGESGVDKRIDVLATAIRGRMSVADLIDLDLAYSPPYGQAKDAVNLAGMLGEDVLSGSVVLWYPGELDEVRRSSLVIDVRSPREFATGHVPGAWNIPHTALRDRLDEVRSAAAGRPVRLLCASGFRSHLAHRVLTQEGFDSATLSGGMITLLDARGPDLERSLTTGTSSRVAA
jgi:NADPH-dependent 2,4-dienoyl-CoA reductase/sulfur reductase-like enzyme/rhodanese-related sulfurtransferase